MGSFTLADPVDTNADSVPDTPTYDAHAFRAMLSVLFGGQPSTRVFGGRSGVSQGTPAGIVTVPTPTTYSVGPHAGAVDLSASGTDGITPYAFTTAQTGSVNPADGSNPRLDLLYVQQNDPSEGDGSSVPGVTIGYLAGTPGSSPSAPATPARSFALATIAVPKTGTGSPSVNFVAPSCAASGGLISCSGSADYPPTPYDGEAVYDRSTDTVAIYNGSIWRTYKPSLGREVTRSTSLSVASSTPTAVTSFAGGTSYNNGDISYGSGIYTFHTAGMIDWDLAVSFPATTATHARQWWVRLNGTDDDHGRQNRFCDGAHGAVADSGGGKIPVAVGDTLQAVLWQSSGGSLAIVPEFFSVALVG